jgi:cytoskeletal protein RodZ
MNAEYYKDIGEFIKTRRNDLKKNISDISKDSRIPEKYLEAIEAGKISEFPSLVYYNLFARSYANELGLNPDEIFTATTEENLDTDKSGKLAGATAYAESETGLSAGNESKSFGKVIIWLVVAAIVIIIGVVIIMSLNPESVSDLGKTDAVKEEIIEVKSDSIYTVAEEIEEPVPADTAEPVEPEIEFPMALRVDAIDSSWVLIIVDDDTVLNRVLYPGDYRVFQGSNRFIVSTGKPSAVSFSLDNIPLKAISLVEHRVRNIEINRQNRKEFYTVEEKETEGTLEDSEIGES